MKKIASLFQRNYDGDKLVRDELVPGAEWVAEGVGVATRKFDGTCCLVRGGRLFKRFDAKAGKTPPTGFEPAQPEADPVTGHWPGWVPVGDGPEDRWHREAWQLLLKTQEGRVLAPETYFAEGDFDGTYELCGPKVQGNPERLYLEGVAGPGAHFLIPHGKWVLRCPRDFAGIKAFLATSEIEGVVWWRDPADPDCDKVKIKAKDFGLRRAGREAAAGRAGA